MQTCSYCGADLPENPRFCGQCGRVQSGITTDVATSRGDTPLPQSWNPDDGTILAIRPSFSNNPTQGSAPAWDPNIQVPTTPLPSPADENEDERKEGLLPWFPPLGDTLLGSAQAHTPSMPVVQGTPQIGSMPVVQGTPQIGSMPIVQGTPQLGSASGAAGSPAPSINGSFNPPAQGATNAAAGNPTPGAGSVAPVSHPVQEPQPTPQPPEQPIHHPIHHPHKPHQPHPIHHKPPKPHPVHHKPPKPHPVHHVASATKVVGGSAVKTIVLVVVAAVVVAAGGVAAAVHFLAHPQPLLSITSPYQVGNALAGATGTTLHLSGQKFSSNSAITFLLDSQVAPGNPGTRSDSNGSFRTDLTITDTWSVGTHILTAKDASNNRTQNSVRVTIVQSGQANTPGPDGAPPDDASFKVVAHIQGGQSTETEIVTGHPDPMGGTVCQPEDNGQPFVTNGVTKDASVPVQKTQTFSCTGSYKGGKLTLTETLLTDVRVYSFPDGATPTCTLNSSQPQIDEQLSGSYTGNNTFSGTITYPAIPTSDYSCNDGYYYSFQYLQSYEQDNWTGQVTDLHS